MSEEQEKPQENQPINLGKNEIPQPNPVNTGFTTPPPFQQPPPFGQFGGGMGMGQQNLPNATAALVLGIIAIPACCFYGIFGLIFGIIAWILGAGDVKKYQLNPTLYTESSYKNAKAGKICGMIATILSVLFIAIVILVIVGAIANPSAYDSFFKGIH
ncbi:MULTISPECIES: CCC motif membrane protein [unclassified Pedobacter]|uniref:CCC motif membrane protein n=1 Tax=Pedobacter TaxID=84567 RepID=UPI001C0ED13D|nr:MULTISPECIES: CCC motif membrane protein [unclassified Pedobacter]MCX2433048.1 CCC motif membrane protein [Pedobacter sp. GR22-10]MCX2586378.1 CCC motif membrane protein [Pedobacter sp. MR22-3]